jgi:hypothetical protein
MHYIRKIGDINGKNNIEKAMMSANRKQIQLCRKHHLQSHGKKYKG